MLLLSILLFHKEIGGGCDHSNCSSDGHWNYLAARLLIAIVNLDLSASKGFGNLCLLAVGEGTEFHREFLKASLALQDCDQDIDRFLCPTKPLVIPVFLMVRVAFVKRDLLATAQVNFFESVDSGGVELFEETQSLFICRCGITNCQVLKVMVT